VVTALLKLARVPAFVRRATQNGDTALIMSATSGRIDIVQLLLDSKADILAANKVVQQPLKYSIILYIHISI
jgi:ankyrin repeat protein